MTDLYEPVILLLNAKDLLPDVPLISVIDIEVLDVHLHSHGVLELYTDASILITH